MHNFFLWKTPLPVENSPFSMRQGLRVLLIESCFGSRWLQVWHELYLLWFMHMDFYIVSSLGGGPHTLSGGKLGERDCASTVVHGPCISCVRLNLYIWGYLPAPSMLWKGVVPPRFGVKYLSARSPRTFKRFFMLPLYFNWTKSVWRLARERRGWHQHGSDCKKHDTLGVLAVGDIAINTTIPTWRGFMMLRQWVPSIG